MKRYAKTNGHAVRNAFEFLRTYICFDSDQTRLCVSTAAKRGGKKTKHVQNQKSFKKYKFDTYIVTI